MAECDKAVREAAFAAAILSEETRPLSEMFRVEGIVVEGGYAGPHPAGYLENGEGEGALFEVGMLPREFVMVSDEWAVATVASAAEDVVIIVCVD